MSTLISGIAAMARNGVMGRGNTLPWHIPEDFQHFKNTTMGKPMIMGRKTFDSFDGKLLPGRPHIVLSRQTRGEPGNKNLHYVHDIDSAIACAKEVYPMAAEIFVIGGAEIFHAAFPYIRRFYLSVIEQDYDGDTMLALDFTGWSEIARTRHNGPPPFTVRTLER